MQKNSPFVRRDIYIVGIYGFSTKVVAQQFDWKTYRYR